jgi:hypothetical protein
MLRMLVLFLCASTFADQPFEYTVVREGPRTTYDGMARIEASDRNPNPCISTVIEIDKGRLAGPVISSDPGKPLLEFAWTRTDEGDLSISWCTFYNPWMQMPHSVPRFFVFYVIKESFGPDDLAKFLDAWGTEDSVWDLDLDGSVDGRDLSVLLAGWVSNEGAS